MTSPKRAEPVETLDQILSRLLDNVAGDHKAEQTQTVEEAVRRITDKLPPKDGRAA